MITKLQAISKIVNSNGRFFGLSFVNKQGREFSIGARFKQPKYARRNQDKAEGFVTVFNVRTNKHQRIQTRRIRSLRIDKEAADIKK